MLNEKKLVELQKEKTEKLFQRSEELLLNILPSEIAEELKRDGKVEAKQFASVTVLLTDFVNFTGIGQKLSPADLVAEVHLCYTAFDSIMEKHGLEKIKTIGDAYMCVSGLPVESPDHALQAVRTALDILDSVSKQNTIRKAKGLPYCEIRIGIHSGPVVAGVVGHKKFAYDIWGDSVNVASRLESAGETGKVNISNSTYDLIHQTFVCRHRGKIQIKNKGEIDMYFVEPSKS